MRIEHKARAHIERAQELLQNDLAFGMNAFNWKDLPDVPQMLSLEKLTNLELQKSARTDKHFLKESNRLKKKRMLSSLRLEKAWKQNNADIMDNEDVVLEALMDSPTALKYASERIQKIKRLAEIAFERDVDALMHYAEQVRELKETLDTLLASGKDKAEILQTINEMFEVHLSEHKIPRSISVDLLGAFTKEFSDICEDEYKRRYDDALCRTFELQHGIFPADPAKAKVFEEICKELWDADHAWKYHTDSFWFRQGELNRLKNEPKGNSLFTS